MGRVLGALLLAILIATDTARAQSDKSSKEWIDALTELTTAIEGTYGDEGPRISAALEKMAASRRPSGLGREAEPAGRLDPADPTTAYHLFRRAAAKGDTQNMQRARDRLAAAYRSLLQDASRDKAAPFADVNVVADSLSDSPVLPPAAYAEGFAHIVRGEYEDAITALRKAAGTDPLVNDPALRTPAVVQSIAAARQGRLADARSPLESAPALGDSSEAHRLLGLIYWANAEDDKSVEQLEIAIRLNAHDERARLALSRVLSSSGRDADAERTLKETVRAFPDSALAHWWLASMYERANRLDDARRELALAAPSAVAGRSQLFAKIGQLATASGDIPGAADAFARSVSARLNDAQAHKRLAGIFELQNLVDEGFVELVAALLIDPRDAGAHAAIGRIYLNANRYDDAVPALRRAIEMSPDYSEARYGLATALMRLGKTQEAAREFDRVEQSQRRMIDEKRRTMSRDVLDDGAKAGPTR